MPRTIVVLDWDITLHQFQHKDALSAMEQELRTVLAPPEATRAIGWCDEAFWDLIRQVRGEPNNSQKVAMLEQMLAEIRGSIPYLVWSRELWLVAASRALAIAIPLELVSRASEAYWQTIGKLGAPYEDAEPCLKALKESGCELAVATASDARLKIEEKALSYDPKYSAPKKTERMKPSPLFSLMHWIFTDDPINKTDPAFWEYVKTVVGLGPDDRIFMIGDSYRSDIIPAADAGVPAILIDRHNFYNEPEKVPLAHRVIKDFTIIPEIIAQYP